MDPATEATQLPSRPSLEQYKKQAKDLVKARKSGDPETMRFIKEHHPRFGKLSDSEIRATFALADAQFSIAHKYGFESWPKFAKHIEALTRERSPVSKFESAVDAVVAGDVATLESLLPEDPELIRERSTRVHRATLLHYVSANGVEGYRQQTPKNAVEVAKILLKAGAEVDAPADVYGGKATTMELLVSSEHPAKAGVQAALVETLLDFGAAINGVEDDGSPLMTALKFHYPDAAEALARRAARIDNIVAAAGLGREDLVRTFVNVDGSLTAGVHRVFAVRWLQLPKDPAANIELALVWASTFGRTGVVEFLLQKGVDSGAKDLDGSTALHCAAWYGHMDTVQLLLDSNAPLEAKNPYGGTVLDQTVWASVHGGPPGVDYVAIVQRLIDAGAKDPGWLQDYLHAPLDERIAEMLCRVIARTHE